MRRRTTCATFLAAALATACGRDGRIETPRPSPAESSRDAAPKPDLVKLDETVRGFLAREGVRAAHVTVLGRGEVVFEKGYGSSRDGEGPPTSRSVFPVGSISKQFTAAAVLALADEGLVRLDSPVRDYLPEWFANDADLRVVHLLTHTSGLADFLWQDGYRELADRPQTPKTAYLALATAAPRRFAPGERWSYSNSGYKALAVLAERVTGRPFYEVLADRVLRPAGLEGIGPCHGLAPEGFVDGWAPSGQSAPLDASGAAYEGDGGLCATASAAGSRATTRPRSSSASPPAGGPTRSRWTGARSAPSPAGARRGGSPPPPYPAPTAGLAWRGLLSPRQLGS